MFFCIHPVVLFSLSCAFRFLFPPSRHFPFFFPLEFFFISPPVAFWVLKGSTSSQALAAQPLDGHCPGPRRSVPSLMVLAVLGSGEGLPRVRGAPRNTHHDFNHLPSNMGNGHVGDVSMQEESSLPIESGTRHCTPPKTPPKPPKKEKLP